MADSWTLEVKSKFDESSENVEIVSMPSSRGNAPIFFGAADYFFVIDARALPGREGKGAGA
jgi:hypothetical protein